MDVRHFLYNISHINLNMRISFDIVIALFKEASQ